MDPKQLERDSSINQMMMRGLERSGLLGQLGRLGIEGTGQIRAGLTGSKEESDRTAALRFLDLMRLMDPDNIDPNTMRPNRNFEFQSDLGQLVDLPLILDNAYKDFEGRGWSKSDVDELGREPGAREASAGDRWVNESRSDADFAKALLSEKHEPTGNTFMDADLSGTGYVAPSDEESYQHRRSKEGEVWQSPPRPDGGLTIPEMLESVSTPQDTAGWLLHKMGGYPQAWLGHNVLGKEKDSTTTLFESLTSSTPENRAAEAQTDAAYVSRRPTVVHKGDFNNWRDKERNVDNLRFLETELSSDSYDQSYRDKHGQYPSYLGSSAVNLAGEMFDYGTIASGLLGGGLGLLGKGLTTGARLSNAGRAAIFGTARELATEDLPIGASIMATTAQAQGTVPKDISGWIGKRQDLPDQTKQEFDEDMKRQDLVRQEARKEFKAYNNR